MSRSNSAFDWKRVEERYIDASDDLAFLLEHAGSDPDNLPLLTSTAVDIACCGVAVKADSTAVWEALRIAGQSSAALFLTASSNKLPVEVSLGDKYYCTFHERPSESSVHAFRWLRGFFINTICRESELIDNMCRTPTELLRQSTTKDPEYRYRFVDALKAFWRRDSQCGAVVLDALELTDPERDDIRVRDWTLNLDVPQLQLLSYINTRDDDFVAEFPKAVELHREFWSSTSKRRNSWEGLVSIELTGLAAIAHRQGMVPEIESEYVPDRFVTGNAL